MKVKFGVSNFHYATFTEGEGGAISFGVPVHSPGTTEISWEPESSESSFAADNDPNYFMTSSNKGGTISITQAMLPDALLVATGLYMLDKNGALVEIADANPKPLALLFEVDTDEKARKNVFYKCMASLPSGSAQTTGENKDPQTEQIKFKYGQVVLDGKKMTKASLPYSEAAATAYDGFYTAVYQPVWQGA